MAQPKVERIYSMTPDWRVGVHGLAVSSVVVDDPMGIDLEHELSYVAKKAGVRDENLFYGLAGALERITPETENYPGDRELPRRQSILFQPVQRCVTESLMLVGSSLSQM
jgi:hypothetical protein